MLLRRYHKDKPLEQPKGDEQEVSNAIVYDEVTKADIAKLLAGKGIEHNERDTKQELYDLLLGSE